MDVDDAASGKLASFLALAKSARGLAAASVIAEATAAPGLFAFGELLDMPHMQEVRTLASRKRLCARSRASHDSTIPFSWRAQRRRRLSPSCGSSPLARWRTTQVRAVAAVLPLVRARLSPLCLVHTHHQPQLGRCLPSRPSSSSSCDS